MYVCPTVCLLVCLSGRVTQKLAPTALIVFTQEADMTRSVILKNLLKDSSPSKYAMLSNVCYDENITYASASKGLSSLMAVLLLWKTDSFRAYKSCLFFSQLFLPKFSHGMAAISDWTFITCYNNSVVGRHLLGPPYKRGALWDLVDLFDIVIPRQNQGTGTQRPRSRLEVELVYR